MSAWEIGIAVAKNRITLQIPPAEWFEETLARYSIKPLPVTWRTAIASTSLPLMHSDPCDRIIIATAIAEGASLVSADRNFPRYPDVRVVW